MLWSAGAPTALGVNWICVSSVTSYIFRLKLAVGLIVDTPKSYQIHYMEVGNTILVNFEWTLIGVSSRFQHIT